MLGLFAQHTDFLDSDRSFLAVVRMAFGLYGFDRYQNEERGAAFDGMGMGASGLASGAGPFKVLVFFGSFFILSLIIPNILLAVVMDAYEKAVDEDAAKGLVFGERVNIVYIVMRVVFPASERDKLVSKFVHSPEAKKLLGHFTSPYTSQLFDPQSFSNWTISPKLLHNTTTLTRQELLRVLQRPGSWTTAPDETQPFFSAEEAEVLADWAFKLWGASTEESRERVENAMVVNSNHIRQTLKEEVKKIDDIQQKMEGMEHEVKEIKQEMKEMKGMILTLLGGTGTSPAVASGRPKKVPGGKVSTGSSVGGSSI